MRRGEVVVVVVVVVVVAGSESMRQACAFCKYTWRRSSTQRRSALLTAQWRGVDPVGKIEMDEFG